jgi:hypothetical protein
MKTKIFVLIVGLLSFGFTSLIAQYNWSYYKNSYHQSSVNVGLFTGEDFSDWQKGQYRAEYEEAYNGLEFLGSATLTYNCHYYAWFQTSQYPSTYYWLNFPEDNWIDYSFVQIPSEQNLCKVTYSQSGGTLYHSAVATSTAGRYISKWGPFCLFEHDYDECPYWQVYEAQVRKYYARLLIIGPSTLACSNGTYTIPNTDGMGYSVDWTNYSYLTEVSSNNYSTTVSPDGNGNGNIRLSISRSGFDPTYYEDLTVPATDYAYSPSDIVLTSDDCINTVTQFRINDNNYFIPGTYFDWDVVGNASLLYGDGSRYIAVEAYDENPVYIIVDAQNGCGTSNDYWEEFIFEDCEYFMKISPNPASDQIEITFTENLAMEKSNPTLEIYNSGLTKLYQSKINNSKLVIDVSSFKSGIYYVFVKNGKNICKGKFIKQ